ncbi:MAG: N-6 DNA methylase [Vicinamibacterales bacterium]
MTLPGIGGWLLPARFLSEQVASRATCDLRAQAQWEHWWSEVAQSCGPATGVRSLFDVAAMPLFGRLGFRARQPRFQPGSATATLITPGGRTVALIVRPWAARPSGLWREATSAAREVGADWCCLFAPPTLSIIPAAGHAQRRSLDLTMPAATHPQSFATFLSLTCAASFDARTLEHWLDAAAREHARVRTDLQRGVVAALSAFRTLPTHHAGRPARSSDAGPSPGRGPADDEALTLVYRILFLLFAESRDLVPSHHSVYRASYTLSSLCEEALRSSTAEGLWDGLAAICRLSRQGGRVGSLEVFPFNGHLFAPQAAPSLESRYGSGRRTHDSDARDAAVGRALIALGTRREPAGRVAISYSDLGVEELGAIYERVLDVDGDGPPRRHSTRRKDTGTFYTPQALADFVVHRTLAPLVENRAADRILDLRIVDPAMGSGAFLVAALRYLSAAYERALVRDGRCDAASISDVERASFRRLIAQQCLFGVDANPVAVQVARLSLWLATLAHTKPLSFLDHRLRVGNSLIGASPADIQRLPGAGTRDLPLFDSATPRLEAMLRRVIPSLVGISSQPDDSVADVRRKEGAWTALQDDAHPLARWRDAVSLWCAQWFWPSGDRRASPGEVRAAANALVHGRGELSASMMERFARVARDTTRRHQCFHWPLEFPDVFYGAGAGAGGFDAVIGNPPWEMVRRDETSGRQGRVRDPLVRFVRESGLFPLCQRGHLNLYQPFLERSLSVVRPGGRVGLVLPWGFAVDDGAAGLRAALVDAGALDTIVGFDNARGLFPIHRGLRFAVIVATPGGAPRDARARFGITATDTVESLTASSDDPLPLQLSASILSRVGGPSRRIPDLRCDRDLQWLSNVMRAHPAVGSADGWHARFSRELNASDDRESFISTRVPNSLPVADGKHIGPFLVHANRCERFIPAPLARQHLPDERYARARVVYRDVSGVGNRFTLVSAVMPGGVVTTHTLFCLRNDVPLIQQHFLCGVFNSNLLNRVVRLLMGSHVTTSLVELLPVPRWEGSPRQWRIGRIARRLAHPGLRDRSRERLLVHLNDDVETLYGTKYD